MSDLELYLAVCYLPPLALCLLQLMIASFDYDPERDSPNPNSEMELGFKRGDEITVFGKIVSIN